MSCRRIEGLLPAFVERGLAPDESAVVAAHLASCPACRESLAAFQSLELTLSARRDEVPSVGPFLAAIGVRSAPSRLESLLRAAVSFPAAAALIVVWAGMLLVRYQDATADVVGRWMSSEAWTALASFPDRVAHALPVGAGAEWVLMAAYVGLSLLLLASAGAMTLRFLRS